MGSITASNAQEVAKFDWVNAVRIKQSDLKDKTPREWLVSPDFVTSLNSTRLLEQNVAGRCGVLSTREIELTEQFSAIELLQKLKDRSLTSVELTTAFCKRACVAQQFVRDLLEWRRISLTIHSFLV